MRPIERGSTPIYPNSGETVVFSDYKDARGHLIKRIGEYCSYCEMHLETSLAVEHVQPKDNRRDLELVWGNFLLACTNCNSTKSKKPIVLEDYLWPDCDNTFQALIYSKGGLVTPSPSLDDNNRIKAQRLIDLVGLDKTPSDDPYKNPSQSDRRWNHRREVFDMAIRYHDCLLADDSENLKDCIIDLALRSGFWSVWFTVFSDNGDLLERLIDAFPGTSRHCFDRSNNFSPIPRLTVT